MVLSVQPSSPEYVSSDGTVPPPQRGTFAKITRSVSASCRRLLTVISPDAATGGSPVPKAIGGNISSPFNGKAQGRAQPRFSELRKEIWKDSMRESWAEVLAALKDKAEQMESLGSKASGTITIRHVYAQAIVS
jgi:hypothetical protein